MAIRTPTDVVLGIADNGSIERTTLGYLCNRLAEHERHMAQMARMCGDRDRAAKHEAESKRMLSHSPDALEQVANGSDAFWDALDSARKETK